LSNCAIQLQNLYIIYSSPVHFITITTIMIILKVKRII